METLIPSFTTPSRPRADQPITVTWCGENLVIRRPKDSVLYFATALGSEIEQDQAAALVDFLDGTLTPDQRKRFFDRVRDRDDPINLATTSALVDGLLVRWNNWPEDDQVEPLVIDPVPAPVIGSDIRVPIEELELDLVAHPPKDIVLFLMASTLAVTSTVAQQAWMLGLFLDAALDPADAMVIARRLRSRDDDLDLHHVGVIVSDLVEKWLPRANRAERRAAARTRD